MSLAAGDSRRARAHRRAAGPDRGRDGRGRRRDHGRPGDAGADRRRCWSALRMKGETVDEVVGAARAMRARMTPVAVRRSRRWSTPAVPAATARGRSTCRRRGVRGRGARGRRSPSTATARCRRGPARTTSSRRSGWTRPAARASARCLAEARLASCSRPRYHAATKHVGRPAPRARLPHAVQPARAADQPGRRARARQRRLRARALRVAGAGARRARVAARAGRPRRRRPGRVRARGRDRRRRAARRRRSRVRAAARRLRPAGERPGAASRAASPRTTRASRCEVLGGSGPGRRAAPVLMTAARGALRQRRGARSDGAAPDARRPMRRRRRAGRARAACAAIAPRTAAAS